MHGISRSNSLCFRGYNKICMLHVHITTRTRSIKTIEKQFSLDVFLKSTGHRFLKHPPPHTHTHRPLRRSTPLPRKSIPASLVPFARCHRHRRHNRRNRRHVVSFVLRLLPRGSFVLPATLVFLPSDVAHSFLLYNTVSRGF